MSLTSAVQKAKDAAAHARPFMKLMDAFVELEGELRGAAQLQVDADAAAKKKADLEAEIPSLQSNKNALTHTVNSLKAEHANTQAAFDASLAAQHKAADDALAAKHTEAKATHDSELAKLKSQIGAAQDELVELGKQKTAMQADIDALRTAVQKAHAAVNA
jgi:chromosome segregation ATPase